MCCFMEKKDKRKQINFRIGPIAQDRLNKVAELFDMKPQQYIKALLYKDLRVFNEPLDRRKSRHRREHNREEWELH